MSVTQLSELRLDAGDNAIITAPTKIRCALVADVGIVPVDLHNACLKRLSRPRNGHCLLPDRHTGDCAGLSYAELGVTDFGPKASKSRRWP